MACPVEIIEKEYSNFIKLSKNIEERIDTSIFVKLSNYMCNIDPGTVKLTDLQAQFFFVINQILNDFTKAYICLCKGYLVDHYFYTRRSIEYIQLYSFISTRSDSDKMLKKFFENYSDQKFKNNHKFNEWFKKERLTFNKEFPYIIQSYDNACKYGTHANAINQLMFQKINKEGFEGEVKFFDLAFNDDPRKPFNVAISKLFLLYIDLHKAVYYYKLSPLKFPIEIVNQFKINFDPFLHETFENLYSYNPELRIK